jgi:hypothetical protein
MMTDEQRLHMITEQLLIVRDNLFRGMSKSMQKLQAKSINEVLELPNFTQSLAQPAVAEQHKQSTTCGEPVVCLECKRLENELERANIKATVWKSAYDVEVGCNEQDTTPPQRKPLTDEELFKEWEENTSCDMPDTFEQFKHTARAIEAAHGIKE